MALGGDQAAWKRAGGRALYQKRLVGQHKPHCVPSNRDRGAGEWLNPAVQPSLGWIDFPIRFSTNQSDDEFFANPPWQAAVGLPQHSLRRYTALQAKERESERLSRL